MGISDIGHKVSEAFIKEFRTADRSYTKGFSREEIRRTMAEFSLDKNSGWYALMKDRVAEIDEEIKTKRDRKHDWNKLWVGFVLGVIATLFGGIILRLIIFKGTP